MKSRLSTLLSLLCKSRQCNNTGYKSEGTLGEERKQNQPAIFHRQNDWGLEILIKSTKEKNVT